MNKFRTLLPAAFMMAAAVLSSCSDDGDLEDRIDKVEDALGANEPLKATFSTTNSNNEVVAKETSFKFKSNSNSEAIWDYQNGEYYVYIERFADVEWEEGAWLEFYYNPETQEISGENFGVYFHDQYGSYRNHRFYGNNDGNTVEIKVLAFNAETGKVSVEVEGSTDASAENNSFSGKTMTGTLKFRGNLRVFKSSAS